MFLNLTQILRRKKRFILILSLYAVVSFFSSQELYADDAQVGKKAPLFSLKDLQGHTYSLEKFIGKKVVHLTFFATWCDPCRKDYQKLNDTYAWFGSKGFLLLGIGVPARQNLKKIEEFAISEPLRFPVLFDSSGEVVNLYNASLPQNIVIDKNGVIVYRWDFLPSNHKEMIKALLSDKR